eukprot:gb/GECG01003816.1/.p1 GENE.gb/GECG01003816.1/~~gb/GECG01003816.1/.p1  ORF type:complete len:499 (+),score=64.86 gb/GECG01003816.1/:1-1497(+)
MEFNGMRTSPAAAAGQGMPPEDHAEKQESDDVYQRFCETLEVVEEPKFESINAFPLDDIAEVSRITSNEPRGKRSSFSDPACPVNNDPYQYSSGASRVSSRKLTKPLPEGVDCSNRFFSNFEWNSRIRAVQNEMVKDDVDLLVVTTPGNIFWLSGFQTTGYYFYQTIVVPAYEEPFMMVRNMEGTGVQARTVIDTCYTFHDTEDPIDTLVELITHTVEAKDVIGFEEDSYFFPSKQQKQFKNALCDKRFVDCSALIERCRKTKSPAELEVMKLAAKATQAGMEAGHNAIKVGNTENDIASEIYRAAFAAGGEYPACPSFVASGPRGYIGHATWEGRELREGDTVFLEIGGCKYRYHTAMMRTAYIGWEIPAKLKEFERIFDHCLTECMRAMRPGVRVCDIDRLSKEIINNNSYGIVNRNRFGYSLGVAFSPGWGEETVMSLDGNNETLLEAGMCFHLIPFVMLDEGTVGISETVRVTPEGAVSFFDYPRQIKLIHPDE